MSERGVSDITVNNAHIRVNWTGGFNGCPHRFVGVFPLQVQPRDDGSYEVNINAAWAMVNEHLASGHGLSDLALEHENARVVMRLCVEAKLL